MSLSFKDLSVCLFEVHQHIPRIKANFPNSGRLTVYSSLSFKDMLKAYHSCTLKTFSGIRLAYSIRINIRHVLKTYSTNVPSSGRQTSYMSLSVEIPFSRCFISSSTYDMYQSLSFLHLSALADRQYKSLSFKDFSVVIYVSFGR